MTCKPTYTDKSSFIQCGQKSFYNGAEDEIRTRDPRLGKAMLYP